MDSKDDSLLRVEGTQYPPYIAPPLGEGLGWGQFWSADPRKKYLYLIAGVINSVQKTNERNSVMI